MGESKTMKRIRVLHSELNGELGGIESFLYNVYRFIDKEKVEFDFLTISDMYFVAFCALVLYKDDYNNFKSYLICAGGALAVSEIYSWMKNISNRSTTVSRLKHD